ncbi:lytic transglycosylase domain-containing protein [Olsenella sp. HMSC062G07]|uniref:lytic transglycosylase domain-containing protein n=1 Tax=Olsenella sp. HMSC062G07 TaxID=1739330 RepID=UPI0008A445B4|nr:lytic transglycosylase domain-containing protein [Olsenella sp. HMSC062G07]OFK24926.1 lytic transglycosylase [Olsenella sp. HMSC062G07]
MADGRAPRFFRWFRVVPLLALLAVCLLTFATDVVVGLAPAQFVRNWFYPVRHASVIEQASAEQGVDPYLVCAVIKCESNWDAGVTSSAGAVGLMQLMPSTAQEMVRLGVVSGSAYDPTRLTDPTTNIVYGTAYLGYLSRHLSSQDEVIAAYNAGIGNVSSWQSGGGDVAGNIQYAETAAYLVRVRQAYAQYKALYPDGLSVG